MTSRGTKKTFPKFFHLPVFRAIFRISGKSYEIAEGGIFQDDINTPAAAVFFFIQGRAGVSRTGGQVSFFGMFFAVNFSYSEHDD